jgi:murein L,D-transpeptidase YcbB/YkuD
MKQYIALIIILALFSCHSGTKEPAAPPSAKDTAAAPPPANPLESDTLIARNTHIDSVNACSDLFLDSADLDLFISQQHLNDTLARELHNFYNVRNFQYAWFDQDGLSEQALAFSSLYQYSKDSSTGRKWLDRELDILQNADSNAGKLTAIDPTLQRTEMLMTWRFFNFLNDRYPNKKQRLAAYLQLIPVQKRDPLEMARSVIAPGDNEGAGPWYQALAGQLKQYLDWQQKGGWERLPKTHKYYRPGDRAEFITAIKKRLGATGEFPIPGANLRDTAAESRTLDTAAADTSKLFDKKLESAIRSFQHTHGLTSDGHIGPDVIKALNIPVEKRIRQILVNLERMRWMPTDSNRKIIVVNIPEFRLQVLEAGHPALTMNVVVGKEGHSTVLFSGKLNRIIFNPYWNIPPSIVKKEVLPAIENDKDYLEEHDMETTGQEGGLPVIRQRPGELNELGRIKFLFPNSFNIYLHDSPHKQLFNMTRRAYSHGCIRIADPRGLAAWLLQENPDWTKEQIDNVIKDKKEKGVVLENPVPVLIVYYTAWVDEEKKLQFRDDIYSHDSAVAQHLFLP